MNKQVITIEEFKNQIYAIIKDEFIGFIFKDEDGVNVNFLNGQKFQISIKEA